MTKSYTLIDHIGKLNVCGFYYSLPTIEGTIEWPPRLLNLQKTNSLDTLPLVTETENND